MAEENPVVGVAEAEPQIEAQEPEAEIEEPNEAETDEDEGEEGEPEDVEFDFGGNKVKLPANATAKEIADKVQEFAESLNKGAQEKFRDVAEMRKSLEAEQTAVQKIRALEGKALETYSRGQLVKQELAQLRQIDINALWQSNPDQARRVSDAISAKQAEFNTIVNRVAQLEGQSTQAQQAEASRRMSEGEAAIEKRIPGFKEKHLPEVMAYAEQQGIPKDDLKNWPLNPVFTQAMWKAMQFDKLQKSATKAATPKPAPAEPIKAEAKSGKGRPALDLVRDADKMSADEWARRRNAQIARANAR
jgi:hypothetical protein